MMIRNFISVVFALLVLCNANPPNWMTNSREFKRHNNRDNRRLDHLETHDGGSAPLLQQASTEAVVPSTGWKKAVFDAHNNARLEHCVPEFTWDETMADYAEVQAEGLCSSGKFQHYSDIGTGENTYTSWGVELSSNMSTHATNGVAAWYAERNQYNYSYDMFTSAALQFTQMVWASSEKIGCGMATCDGSNGPNMVLICNYYPPVNFSASFPDNVLNPTSCGRRHLTPAAEIHDGPAACECACHMDDTEIFKIRVLMDKLPETII